MNINRDEKTITISQGTGVSITVGFILLLLGAVASGGAWLATTQSKLADLAGVTQDNKARIATLESDSNINKVKYAEIQTQLKSIETNLLDIKQAIKGQ